MTYVQMSYAWKNLMRRRQNAIQEKNCHCSGDEDGTVSPFLFAKYPYTIVETLGISLKSAKYDKAENLD